MNVEDGESFPGGKKWTPALALAPTTYYYFDLLTARTTAMLVLLSLLSCCCWATPATRTWGIAPAMRPARR